MLTQGTNQYYIEFVSSVRPELMNKANESWATKPP